MIDINSAQFPSLLTDVASASVTYVGISVPNTTTASATWTIQKVTTTGSNVRVQYPNGNPTNAFVWDNRASYTYTS